MKFIMNDNIFIKNLNICFLGGVIRTQPNFRFFYNNKKYISKVSFILETEPGYIYSQNRKHQFIEVIAYNEKADLIYQKFNINDRISLIGNINKYNVILESL